MSIPFHQLTDEARRAMELADAESRRLNHEYIGTEHILLGVLQEEGNAAASILKDLAVDPGRVLSEIEKLVQIGPDVSDGSERPFTPRAAAAIRFATEESRRLLQKSVGPEHLLVGLVLEGAGVAGVVLRNLGLGPQQLRPAAFKIRLTQIKTVEQIVRPVRAATPRKRKMREELLAHLENIYDEEQARLHDPAAAIVRAASRLGDPAALTRELEASLPRLERYSYRMERRFGWRAPESAARYTLRVAFQLFALIAFVVCIGAAVVVFSRGWNRADWIVFRPALVLLVVLPLDEFVLGLLYYKIRDAIWGVFGARRSMSHALLLGLAFAGVVVVSGLGFIALATWDLNWAAQQIYPVASAALIAATACFALARQHGRVEIADTLWACLEIDTPGPSIVGE